MRWRVAPICDRSRPPQIPAHLMLLPLRLALTIAACACLAACASRTTASIPRTDVPASQTEADEQPEPLPPGIKPLTVEQEETISQ
jgi:type IV pilus biogenesis protein CpaD/CtpE